MRTRFLKCSCTDVICSLENDGSAIFKLSGFDPTQVFPAKVVVMGCQNQYLAGVFSDSEPFSWKVDGAHGLGLQYWLTQPASHRKVTNPTIRFRIPHQPSPRFHYTTKGNFNAICSSAYLTPELYSALKDADGSVFG